MNAVVRGLQEHATLYERYHAQTGASMGERGSILGAAPVGLFLKTLGVEILSPSRVRLEGINPFPWPVTLVYRGLRVVRGTRINRGAFFESARHHGHRPGSVHRQRLGAPVASGAGPAFVRLPHLQGERACRSPRI